MSNKELEMKAREHDMSDITEKVIAEVTEAAAEEVTTGYKKIEEGVVEGFGKVTDKCVEVLFAREGESIEDAKARLSGKNKQSKCTLYTYSIKTAVA